METSPVRISMCMYVSMCTVSHLSFKVNGGISCPDADADGRGEQGESESVATRSYIQSCWCRQTFISEVQQQTSSSLLNTAMASKSVRDGKSAFFIFF